MLRADLYHSLCDIRRQCTVDIDTWQWFATEMFHHVIDCTYLLLNRRHIARTLDGLGSLFINLLDNSTETFTTAQHLTTPQKVNFQRKLWRSEIIENTMKLKIFTIPLKYSPQHSTSKVNFQRKLWIFHSADVSKQFHLLLLYFYVILTTKA